MNFIAIKKLLARRNINCVIILTTLWISRFILSNREKDTRNKCAKWTDLLLTVNYTTYLAFQMLVVAFHYLYSISAIQILTKQSVCERKNSNLIINSITRSVKCEWNQRGNKLTRAFPKKPAPHCLASNTSQLHCREINWSWCKAQQLDRLG